MARLFHIMFWGLVGLYLITLMLWAVGTFGWFGQDRDPLAAVYLVILGLPWNRFIDALPEATWPWFGALTPLLNIAILFGFARVFTRR